jgi:hypothetical protein
MAPAVLLGESLRFFLGAGNVVPPAPLEDLLITPGKNLKRLANLLGMIELD